ncbi:MAG: TolC family protein [Prevotella sp.]
MRRKSIAALLLAVFCMPLPTSAQRRTMTLDELYQLAEEQSQSIKTFKTAIESATQGVAAAKSQRLPDIGASLSIGYLGDGLLSDRDFSDWQHINNPHPTNNFALRAQQVIYSGGAISGGISLAELGKTMAELDWKKNRQEIRFIITAHYLDLCKLQNSQRVVEDNLRLTEQVISNMEARRNQGTALKTDITRYELQREALRLQRTKLIDAQMVISHQLVTTLHLPAETVIAADAESLTRESQILAETEWQRIAADNNAGLKQSETAIQMNEKKVKLERAEMMPKVAIVAEEHFDGPITTEVPVIDKNINYWFAGIGVSYNISSLFKSNKKLQQQKTNLRQSREQHVVAQESLNNAVQATYTDYLTAFKELETQRKSVELADQCYKVTENRYKNGLALLTDMLDASNSKLSADLGLVDANINILYNYYKLKYIANIL